MEAILIRTASKLSLFAILLLAMTTSAFAHEKALRTAGQANDALINQRIVEHEIGPPQTCGGLAREQRRVAWTGLVLCPILLVALNLVDYSLPGILSVGLVIAFIASFGYLVATMAPRDPDDDGARV